MSSVRSRSLTGPLACLGAATLVCLWVLGSAAGSATAHDAVATPSPTLAPQAQVDIDKCVTVRPAVEAIIGTLSSAPRRSFAFMQDMPSLTCDYRADGAWLTVTFIMGRDRDEFEHLAALVPGVARLDGVADVALTVPPTPLQSPAGATIVFLQGGTSVEIQAAASTTSANQLTTRVTDLARTIASDDRLLHGHDMQATENQPLQGGG